MQWDPDLIVIFGGIFATLVGYRLAGALSTFVRNRTTDPPDLRAMRQRMEEIGTAVDAIAIEVERIAEAQRFSTKLLAGRAEQAVGDPEPRRSIKSP